MNKTTNIQHLKFMLQLLLLLILPFIIWRGLETSQLQYFIGIQALTATLFNWFAFKHLKGLREFQHSKKIQLSTFAGTIITLLCWYFLLNNHSIGSLIVMSLYFIYPFILVTFYNRKIADQ